MTRRSFCLLIGLVIGGNLALGVSSDSLIRLGPTTLLFAFIAVALQYKLNSTLPESEQPQGCWRYLRTVLLVSALCCSIHGSMVWVGPKERVEIAGEEGQITVENRKWYPRGALAGPDFPLPWAVVVERTKIQ